MKTIFLFNVLINLVLGFLRCSHKIPCFTITVISMGRGGGLVVSMVAFNHDSLSSNLTDVCNFYVKYFKILKTQVDGIGPFRKGLHCYSEAFYESNDQTRLLFSDLLSASHHVAIILFLQHYRRPKIMRIGY